VQDGPACPATCNVSRMGVIFPNLDDDRIDFETFKPGLRDRNRVIAKRKIGKSKFPTSEVVVLRANPVRY